MNDELQKILQHLRLGGLLAQWEELLATARRGRFSHERLLKHVFEAEYRVKTEQARILRRKRAHIPEILEIETFPFSRQPKLDRKRVMSLYDSFDYMTKQQNIAWFGPTGCGKTGLATGFLLQALDRGHRGYFITFPELVAKLYASLADHSQEKLLRKFARYDCLVIDEIGYVEVEPTQVGLFFTLMQKPSGRWVPNCVAPDRVSGAGWRRARARNSATSGPAPGVRKRSCSASRPSTRSVVSNCTPSASASPPPACVPIPLGSRD